MIANLHQAKTHLSRLVQRTLTGEEVILAKSGKPVAKMVPLVPAVRRRPEGWESLDIPAEVFFEPLSENELFLWEGGWSMGSPAPRSLRPPARRPSKP